MGETTEAEEAAFNINITESQLISVQRAMSILKLTSTAEPEHLDIVESLSQIVDSYINCECDEMIEKIKTEHAQKLLRV